MSPPRKTGSIQGALIWLGFATPEGKEHGSGHGHDHKGGAGHGHTHGVVDPTIATSDRGIWAIKWSFVILAITAALQLTVALTSGSVALLADTIHNIGDAATAVPLWIAFTLARRKPSQRFTYGLGRVEDLAGLTVVAIILFSALVAGYQAVDRFIHPQSVRGLVWVAAAGVVGFLGNEAVAIFRIRVGRKIESAALIADGYHARTDGLTSLAVVVGAAGVWMGFPLADPIIGLLITLAIMGIVWQSSKAVFTRMLDGVEPAVIEEIRHAAEHIPGVTAVRSVRARWSGHRLLAEVDVAAASGTSLGKADALAAALEGELAAHLPALGSAHVRVQSEATPAAATAVPPAASGHTHAAPKPVKVAGRLASGELRTIDTPDGERFQFVAKPAQPGLAGTVAIRRGDDWELLPLDETKPGMYRSREAPQEPHEFTAELRLRQGRRSEVVPFSMTEPEGRGH